MGQITILKGGRSTEEVVKIGDTVHRSVSANSAFIHQLLQQLEKNNFKHAPKFLGIDEKGREILSFVEGNVPVGGHVWTEVQLTRVALILRQFHDATAGSALAGNEEVVCHNDIAPWNTIIQADVPIAFIDFDDSAPGKRVDDLAYMIWTFLELGSDIDVNIQANKIKLICDTYGHTDAKGLLEAIVREQQKILAKRELLSINSKTQADRDFSADKVVSIKKEIQWTLDNRKKLIEFLAS